MTRLEAWDQLKQLSCSRPNNFNELIANSRSIINCWIEAGLTYPNLYIEEFVSIDSQADYLRSSTDEREKQDFYNSFCDIFFIEAHNLSRFLIDNQPNRDD